MRTAHNMLIGRLSQTHLCHTAMLQQHGQHHAQIKISRMEQTHPRRFTQRCAVQQLPHALT